MKLPDGNKPIKVGDPSFIYKGVYNPIYWVGKEPYRPRVETLVIKDARYVYANIDDNIDRVPPDRRNHSYSLPGGSLDSDSTKIEQAEAETNEEALVKVTLLYNSGISYYDLYEPGFILKGGDTPLEYVGSISDIFVGVYDGPYDKSLVEEKDLDQKMAEHGKFHEIRRIAKYLRKEHVEALIASQFVAEDVKAELRLMRSDNVNESTSPILVPDRYIYHGSYWVIDEFRPMSLDLGNAFEGPGWSTFCFGDYESAKLFGFMKAMIRKYKDIDHKDMHPRFLNGKIEILKDELYDYSHNHALDCPLEFYVYKIDSVGLNIGIGNDPTLKEYTFRESGVKPISVDEFHLSPIDLKEQIEVVEKISDSIDTSEYKNLQTHNYRSEDKVRDALKSAIDNGELKPGDDVQKFMDEHDISFDNDDIPMPELMFGVDEPVFENLDSGDIITETEYPIECYGLPERKAYPMPDEKHVRSAIRFFNYASKDEEKELAKKINKMIKKFKIKDINVGEKNRFKKYYQPITEDYSLEDYRLSMSSLIEQIQNTSDNEKKYALYEQSKNVIRMMMSQMECDGFGIMEEDKKTELMNQGYNTLAEISENQMDILKSNVDLGSIMENTSRSLMYVLEADDDNSDEEDGPETATDYDQMADDMDDSDDTSDNEDETEDTSTSDDSGDDPDTSSDDETATDYDQMADEQDTENEEEPVTTEDNSSDSGDTDTTSDDTSDTEDPTDDSSADDNDTDTTDDSGMDDSATDYDQMADDADGSDDSDSGGDTDEPTESDDTNSDTSDSTDDTTSETGENNNRYDNKELKNYFLLNSFMSMHETVVDVLDTASGVILPTPDANSIMGKVVKNLQSIKAFVEKFIQFHFSDSDYAFNLYYYNILISALNINLKLLETAMQMGEANSKKTTKKEEK